MIGQQGVNKTKCLFLLDSSKVRLSFSIISSVILAFMNEALRWLVDILFIKNESNRLYCENCVYCETKKLMIWVNAMERVKNSEEIGQRQFNVMYLSLLCQHMHFWPLTFSIKPFATGNTVIVCSRSIFLKQLLESGNTLWCDWITHT